jgi:choline dehydrogenase-like flavoprotein
MNYEIAGSDTLYGADAPKEMAEWLLRRSGKLTSSVAEVSAFVRTRAGLPAADIQFHLGAAFYERHGAVEHDGHAAVIAPALVAPKARGEVTLHSPDPTAKPKILTNSLTDPDDVASLLAGMRLARRIAASSPLREKVVRELTPGGDVPDADLERSLRERAELLYHPVGTCAIGSVLDPELRVLGLDGIRVVDASVFPVIPGGNTNAPTIMVAERAADLIRGRAATAASHA